MSCPRILLAAALLVAGVAAPLALAQAPARTKENVQKKAVIVKQDAKVYDGAQGDAGKEAAFMRVFFLHEGETNGRVPVAVEPNSPKPTGWLAKGSFAEWNTLQMINFEAQSGRELAKIFGDAPCAQQYGDRAATAGCTELGSEPQRTGKKRDDYSLLVPVFDRESNNYQGGFVRVSASGPVVAPQTNADGGGKVAGSAKLGYDLVLVVDATASMDVWFKPTTEVLDSFVSAVQSQVGGGEMQVPLHVGLLFYRDRKREPNCDIGFLTQWAVELTDNVAAVNQALNSAQKTDCSSDEVAEAVFDALNRALLDPKWHDGNFKVVLLVGDAPPHPASDQEKNPMDFTVDAITKMSEERNVRFLTLKIGNQDTQEFKDLAGSVKDSVMGRFRAIEPNPAEFRNQLGTALREEWELLTKANQVRTADVTPEELKNDPNLQRRFDIDAYELPIIIANLPPSSSGGGSAPDFVTGWVPKHIKSKLAVGEFVFMAKNDAKILANVVDTIAVAAQEGITEGSDAFLQNLRQSLSTMLKMPPDDVFRSGESLESMMKKAEILPFKTTVLSFTAEEVNTWRPADFERLNKNLSEKIGVLREFIQKPSSTRLFGSKEHIYVPRDLFP